MKKVKFTIFWIFFGMVLISNEIICQTYITTDTEFNTPQYFNDDLIVTEGYELVVKSDVHFGEGAKLIVQRTAKLTIDGGTLTNLNNNMWPGVELWGTKTGPQTSSFQGSVEIKNQGSIQYARIGIRTIKATDNPGGGETFDYAYTGGIVIACSSFFNNNRVAVQFYPYPQNSVSRFVNCDFLTNDDYIDAPDYFVRIHRISGIPFLDCSYGNASLLYDFLGSGIYASDATFYVGKYLQDVSEFRKLNYGIHVDNTTTAFYPDIRESYFTENRRSIYISSTDGARVTSCVFLDIPDEGYGLYLNNSFKYHVEDNVFQGKATPAGIPPVSDIGIYINNSGGLWNQIYNNEFYMLEYGTIAYELNRNPKTGSGLCIECNDYDENISDIVVDGPGSIDPQNGIANQQGYLGLNDTLPAGNTFTETTETWFEHNYYNSGGMAFITYVYHGINPFGLKLNPYPYYSSSTMYRIENPFVTYSKEIACPSKLETTSSIEEESSAMEYADVQIEQKNDSLNDLIDGGNTFTMNLDVLTSTTPEAQEIYSELLSESPYISDTVLKSAIYKENVLPNAMIRDVLVANPHSAKNGGIMNTLDNRFNPMPDWMKEQVLDGLNIQSDKEQLESRIRSWDRNRSRHFENIYQHYRKDTVNPETSSVSFVSLLEQDSRLESKYRLAFFNLEHGDSSEVEELLESIPNEFDLTSLEETIHQDYISLFTVLNQLSGELPLEGSQEATELNILAANDKHYPGACARNLLIVAGLLDYEEPIILPEEELKSSEIIDSNDLFNNTNKSDAFNVFPNPASDYFILDYDAQGYSGEITIKASDMNGKSILIKNYSARRNQEVINIADWQAGLYSISLIINGKIVESKKISIKH